MNIIAKVDKLKRSKIKKIVESRIREFEEIGKNPSGIFSEMCFCIMTANFQAEKSIKIQEELKDGFCNLGKEDLAKKLGELGHRFPNTRAEYICGARKFREEIINKVKNLDEFELREWLVKNIRGLGMKEASHFLRNIGFKNLAIIDFHIIDLLTREKLIGNLDKKVTKKRYLEIEDVLKNIALRLNLNLAELDLYLWYIETGKVLK